MATWDLPAPQGPNLAGIELPESARRGAEQVSLELPLTTRLPARFPIRDVIAEIRNQTARPHLAEWHEILDREGKNGPGLRQFRTMLHIQFFRDIVLASRYLDRFKGRVEALDRAFGVFFDVSQDSVKKIRLEAEHRCNQ
jgi:hypothetical protein